MCPERHTSAAGRAGEPADTANDLQQEPEAQKQDGWYLDDIGAALLGPIRSALSALEAADRSFAETLSQPLRAEPRREGKLIEETQP